jgi:membrane protein required for colicin V production
MCAAWVVAVIAAPKLDLSACDLKSAPPPTWIVLIATFVVAGAVICALLRLIVGEMVGSDLSIPDRIAGLGAFRIVLLAVLLVLLFGRVIPSGREPAFLKESQWRPVLSSATQYGLQSLPPEVDDYIDRLKRQRRI